MIIFSFSKKREELQKKVGKKGGFFWVVFVSVSFLYCKRKTLIPQFL